MRRILVAVLLAACGNSSGTGGKPASFEMGFRAQSSEVPSFQTQGGWTISLTRAVVSLGPVYLYANPPPIARFSPLDLLVRPAFAHVGFDDETLGQDRGEMLSQMSIDALATARVSAGTLAGIAGAVHSATIGLDPATSGPSDLAGHSAFFAGMATKGAAAVSFSCALDLPDTGTHRKAVNIPVGPGTAGIELADGVSVDVVLHPARWLADVNPDEFAPGAEVAILPGSQAFGAIEGGIRKFGAFTVEPRP